MSTVQNMTMIIATFALTIVIGYAIIPILHKMKFGQTIREEGPKAHQQKAGTPTMGGLIFFASITISTLVFSLLYDVWSTEVWIMLIVFIGYGLIGFLDDFIIVVMKRNLGLTSLQKLVAQIVVGIIAYFLLRQSEYFDTAIAIPFTSWTIDLGIFYVVFLVFWLVGFSNAINLTDGLDGLVGGTTFFTFVAFAWIAYAADVVSATLVSVITATAMLGFLYFNRKPAKVFMGDTGSLALGGLIATISILLKIELLLLLIGLVYVIETLSVIIQVISFKTTGKRVFKMSPIHHHFELSGWSEWRVVLTFWFVSFISALIAVLLEVYV
ncbi:phospho-N-acetylmuramoyl-pentapeptide-transferase [Savagea sp. SN6]|uniref:Phospho-N-acetylmuramoyl-pentapeptide-transferase n=1 Tax=Savagea serpentis TaxID=2785297 RepID=A0A8J7G1A8_9BACL|nr:phospho-N-acetylmuramoyl-pentapeptide-transferase [Savagea serpentis]MBF4499862.1 phospho-N-acetylmuramoyl-pentapeptide-transferase [Savagea serpentis]